MPRKIAICLSGEARCWKNGSEQTFIENFLQSFNKDDFIDIYIVTWNVAYGHIPIDHPNNYYVTEDSFKSLNTDISCVKKIIIRDSSELKTQLEHKSRNHVHLNNHLKNVIMCHDILIDSNYDIVMRIRPDLTFYKIDLNLSKEELEKNIFTVNSNICQPPDVLYYSSKSNMDKLINLFKSNENHLPCTHGMLRCTNPIIKDYVHFNDYRNIK